MSARQTEEESFYYGSARRVRDMPSRQRPREEVDRVGVENVSDGLLLALILRSGVQGASVVDVAEGLLNEFGSLTSLSQVSVDELAARRGMGRVKAQVLKAALELAHRMTEERTQSRPEIIGPESAAAVLRQRARAREEEAFWVLLLDTKNRLIRQPVEISKGLLDASLVHPREVFREAIRSSCAAVILAHNHPSGDPSPSSEDIRITKQLVGAGQVVDIHVLDHVILGRSTDGKEEDYISLCESGLVNFSE